MSYSFWVGAAAVAVDRLETVFEGYWRNEGFVVIQLACIAVLVAFVAVDWPRLLSPRASPP